MKTIKILPIITVLIFASCSENGNRSELNESDYKAKKDSVKEVYENQMASLHPEDDSQAIEKLKEEKKDALKQLDEEFKPEKKEKKKDYKEEKSATEKAEKKALKLKEELNLDNQQYQTILNLLTSQEEKKQKIKMTYADNKDKEKEEKKKIEEEYDTKIRSVLTEGQNQKYKGEMKKDKK